KAKIPDANRTDRRWVDDPIRTYREVLVVSGSSVAVLGIEVEDAAIARRPAGHVRVIVSPASIQLKVRAYLVIDAPVIHLVKRTRLLTIENVLHRSVGIRRGDAIGRHPRVDVDDFSGYRIETAQRDATIGKGIAYPASIRELACSRRVEDWI